MTDQTNRDIRIVRDKYRVTHLWVGGVDLLTLLSVTEVSIAPLRSSDYPDRVSIEALGHVIVEDGA